MAEDISTKLGGSYVISLFNGLWRSISLLLAYLQPLHLHLHSFTQVVR